MIKRTLFFGNPAYLSLANKQLVVKLPQVEKNESLNEAFKMLAKATIPIEDIGVVILDEQQITITHALLSALMDNNVAVITCDNSHHPNGLLMPLSGNTVQTEKFKAQIEASVPLKKNLWQQTVQQKILNQAALLKRKNIETENMHYWAESVRSGDPDNYEARAAAYYWSSLSPLLSNGTNDFRRDRFGLPPNNLLNYGYSILRAIVARSLVGSGLLPTLGIHHRNKYNAYCLADDIMEPYRPFVDEIVLGLILQVSGANNDLPEFMREELKPELTTEIKKELLGIATVDVKIKDERSPLMVGMQRTTASIAKCFEGESKKISYPEFV